MNRLNSFRALYPSRNTHAPESNRAYVVGAVLSLFIASGLLIAFGISHVRALLSLYLYFLK